MKCASVPVLIFLAASSLAAADKPTTLANARDAIEANLKTPEGKAYEQQLGKEWMDKYPGPVKHCKQNTSGDPEPFWILLKLAKDGAVKEVLLHPETKLGTCVRETLLKDRFSAPPHPDHWVGIYLKLTK